VKRVSPSVCQNKKRSLSWVLALARVFDTYGLTICPLFEKWIPKVAQNFAVTTRENMTMEQPCLPY
jgi:hypothetical protein